eukprot:484682-Pelagomonas_calceolata.AAC.4
MRGSVHRLQQSWAQLKFGHKIALSTDCTKHEIALGTDCTGHKIALSTRLHQAQAAAKLGTTCVPSFALVPLLHWAQDCTGHKIALGTDCTGQGLHWAQDCTGHRLQTSWAQHTAWAQD